MNTMNVENLMSNLTAPISYPDGGGGEELLNYLMGFTLDGESLRELEGYLLQDFNRFVYTLNLVSRAPKIGNKLLEIGSNPYFTTILLSKFTDYKLTLTNYFGPQAQDAIQVCENTAVGDRFEYSYMNHNVDDVPIPSADKFDVVVFCEVIEHLINDPIKALLRIKRAMNVGGTLILSTPNVCRLENVAKMVAGANIYDPFSGYGPYGRHNREYNKHELHTMLTMCGFEVQEMFSTDVHHNNANSFYPLERITPLIETVPGRQIDLGQYIFVRAVNKDVYTNSLERPDWLYRSYSDHIIRDV